LEAAGSAWWYARFRIEWPPDLEPAWHTDLLIAHRVVKPAIERHWRDIPLWRFHRRAARDEAGHQFSFIFFAPADAARRIYAELSAHPLLGQAAAAGRSIGLACDDPATVSRPGVDGTSDPAWSGPLRQAWPFYMLGASRMWLELISAVVADDDGSTPQPSYDELDSRYAEANSAITGLWQTEGRHAFLHHLNALFGYEPITIIERRQMRF
jgi:hypothetical protein